jgi:hypothetical protein
MAKNIGRLAGLAALAGAAYMASKGKDEPKGKEDTGPGYKSTETRKDEGSTADTKTKSDVLEAITKPKEKSNDAAGNQGVLSPKSIKPASTSKPAVSTSDRRDLEAGTTRGRPAEAKKPSTSTSSSSAEGMKNYKPRSTQATPVRDTAVQGLKTAVKTAAQGPAAGIATAAKPLADKAASSMRETYRDLSGKVQYKTPDLPSAAKTVSDAAVSGAKKVGSGIADYVKNFETPAERRSRERKESSGMKRGGAVKMASGGMAASRRGDGIAQRGKTRGKMC